MNRRRFSLPVGRWKWVLAVVLIGAGSLPMVWADLAGPTVEDRTITLAVTRIMRDGHITRHDLNDEIAERLVTNFLKMLDGSKRFFYQTDVDQFRAQQNQLDDNIRLGKIDFAFKVFDTYLKRVDERVQWIDQLLAMPCDFTVEEEIVRDPDVAKYPVTEEEDRDLWRKTIKYDLLVLKANEKLEGQEARDKLSRRYHGLQKRMHQLKQHELLEWYLTSMTTAYDPHSTYMSPATKENFEIQMRLKLQGIGAQLQYDDGYTVVHKVIAGGAADKDGRLKKKDRVVGVGQGAVVAPGVGHAAEHVARPLDLAAQRGCDGVEPDNVDGYSNDNGFGLTAAGDWVASPGWCFDALPDGLVALFSCLPSVNRAAVAVALGAADAASATGEHVATLLRGLAPSHATARQLGLPTVFNPLPSRSADSKCGRRNWNWAAFAPFRSFSST